RSSCRIPPRKKTLFDYTTICHYRRGRQFGGLCIQPFIFSYYWCRITGRWRCSRCEFLTINNNITSHTLNFPCKNKMRLYSEQYRSKKYHHRKLALRIGKPIFILVLLFLLSPKDIKNEH